MSAVLPAFWSSSIFCGRFARSATVCTNCILAFWYCSKTAENRSGRTDGRRENSGVKYPLGLITTPHEVHLEQRGAATLWCNVRYWWIPRPLTLFTPLSSCFQRNTVLFFKVWSSTGSVVITGRHGNRRDAVCPRRRSSTRKKRVMNHSRYARVRSPRLVFSEKVFKVSDLRTS